MQPIKAYSRREFLQILGGASIFAASPVKALRMSSDFLTVSIIHTTDLHGNILPTSSYGGRTNLGGLARCATQIRLWKKENPYHMLVDAGDLYQGTKLGLHTQGKIMVDALNHLGYDAWVLGNHEFDWGMDPVHEAILMSEPAVLAANCLIEGKPAGRQEDPNHPLGRIAPYALKQVGGFRIGIIGLITPGMPYWFHQELYRGLEFVDPLEPVRRSIDLLQARNADAILLAGHMGLRAGGDDFANRTQSLLETYPNVVAFIGGHTHQHVRNTTVHATPFTQANYFGIHAGRLDITFDRNTRRIVTVLPSTTFMHEEIALDPTILSLAQPAIDETDAILDTTVGTLKETLTIARTPRHPSPLEKLIGAAMMETLESRGLKPDAVVHGLIFPDGDFEAGKKTVRDIWDIMPYENHIVTAQLTREEIFTILAEALSSRSVMGMFTQSEGVRGTIRIHEVFDQKGRPLQKDRRYLVAFNSYDSASGGRRLMQLREIMHKPESQMRMHPVLTRNAIIDYFSLRQEVTPITRFDPPAALKPIIGEA